MGTFFRNATLVEFAPPRVEVGHLRQVDGRIVAVGLDAIPESDDELVDCDGAVLIPGLVNGHTHLYSALSAGMPAPPQPPRSFHEILQFIWWRLDRAHTLESIEVSGQIGALAALKCGTTTLIDHHASPEAIDGSLSALEQGIAQVGCRGVLCYETTDRNRLNEAEQGLMENERYLKSCAERQRGQFAGLVGGHASFTLDEESLAGCVELAKRWNVGVHIHVAEDPIDRQLTRARFACGLLERFEHHGLLDVPGTILAHGTHLSDEELCLVDDHHVTVTLAHNPCSNMNNGVGYTPVARLSKCPLLGTDGIGADMFREARVAQFKGNDARLPLPSGDPLEMLAQNARLASHSLKTHLGELTVGAAADIVLTDYRPAVPLSADNLAGHLIYAWGPEYVRHVMINGCWCLRDRSVMTCDEPALRSKAVNVAKSLYERMADIPY